MTTGKLYPNVRIDLSKPTAQHLIDTKDAVAASVYVRLPYGAGSAAVAVKKAFEAPHNAVAFSPAQTLTLTDGAVTDIDVTSAPAITFEVTTVQAGALADVSIYLRG